MLPKAFNFRLLTNLIPVPKTWHISYGNLFSSNGKESSLALAEDIYPAGIATFLRGQDFTIYVKHLAIILNTVGLLQITLNFCYIRN